jgi:hypothetical protein
MKQLLEKSIHEKERARTEKSALEKKKLHLKFHEIEDVKEKNSEIIVSRSFL